MEHYAGIDVSLESASLCVVDATGRIVREAKVASEPEVLIGWFGGLGLAVTRIGLEAGPLSQWLYAGMRDAGLAVELLETRHVRNAFKAMPVKTDRKDARGIAQLMRLGWFRPVHCKSLPAQEVRALLTARKLLQTKNHDVEMSLRGVLRGFGLKVGPTTPRTFAGRIRELVAGHTTLSTVAEALLEARGTLFEQWQKLEKRLRSLAREDCRVRRLMTAPGVGPIVALTYASAIDDPGRFRSSKAVGAYFGLTPKKYQSGDRHYRPHLQDRRRWGAHRPLRGRQRHSNPAGKSLHSEELGNAPGRSCRHAQGQGRARPQARRVTASHAGRQHGIPR